jgi:hypothetical protein
MFKFLFCLITIVFASLIFSNKVNAVFDPLEKANNFFGIHILFPSELDQASSLVNSTDGAWGYVTIPIQSSDKDLVKWQSFMNEAREKKLIPIVRLATEPLYSNTSVWRKPEKSDIIDFANFLNSLDWPVENRYVVIYNEVNRFDEWGGEAPNPQRYGELLSFSYDVFKRRSEDFYIIMAGLDNASPNDRVLYMDNLAYIKEMIDSNPDIVNKMDGFSSHSYPNPAFSQPPSATKIVGTATYKYEYELINENSDKKIPVFITETGWISDNLSEDLVASYYKTAYEQIWGQDKDKIVAITPFLLNSTGGQFENFSFIINGEKSKHYESTKNIGKTTGTPLLSEVKGVEIKPIVAKVERFFTKTTIDTSKYAQNLVTEYIKIFF